ncbi:MAG: cytochrome c [Bacteroidota bacterium]|nr:cytochrome c [Bacteroidota bacterium]
MAHNPNKKKFNVFDLFRDLEKFYGVLYLFLLIFLIYLGAKYVETLDYNNIFYSPPLLSADSNMRTTGTVKRGALTPPVDLVKFTTMSADITARGKELYLTNCASCHGATGNGDGAAGTTLVPPPRNFVNPQAWKIGPKITQMYITLQEGIPNTAMASFSIIPPEERLAIIQFVQTFNPTYPKDNPDDLTKLDDTYKLSKGGKLPNEIPLPLAIELSVLNYDTLKNDLQGIEYKIEDDKAKNDSSAILFKEIVSDKSKALNSLANDMKWNENLEAFVKFIETDPLDKGFKTSVYHINPGKMNLFYQYMKGLFTKNKV